MKRAYKINFFGEVSFLILLLSVLTYSQSKTNLQVCNELVDSSLQKVIQKIPAGSKNIILTLSLGNDYSVFSNNIYAGLQNAGYKISVDDSGIKGELIRLNYVIDNVSVKYSDLYRDGIWGDYYLKRTVLLSGSYSILGKQNITDSFIYSATDSVRNEEIKLLENSSYEFTRSEKPAEPFLSSLLEPVIAISAAAAAVILFFSIRSK
ncbi:MAG: hypothetical protein Kow0098_25860 [Ignavibacteriaceae bacterium]